METVLLNPQQEQIVDETAPVLRPWTTPQLMRLAGDDSDTVKNWPSQPENNSDYVGPS